MWLVVLAALIQGDESMGAEIAESKRKLSCCHFFVGGDHDCFDKCMEKMRT